MDNLYTLITGKYREGKTDLDRLINPAIVSIFRRLMNEYIKKYDYPELTEEEKRAAKDFYKKYGNIDLIYHRVLAGRSGKFCPEYIPEDIFYTYVEPYYTDRLYSKYLDNKCLYYSFYSNLKQPGLIAMRYGKYWTDQKSNFVTEDEVAEMVRSLPASVIKRAAMSEGGHGVEFLDGDPDSRVEAFRKFVKENETDIVLQEAVIQHPEYAKLHPASVNTIRLMSILSQDGVWVFAKAGSIGAGGSKVDNLNSGGVFCSISDEGRLAELGVLDDGRVITEHPDFGYRFSDVVLPHLDKAVKLVEQAHGIMAHTRLASWDIAIDEAGDAVLIEANLALGTIHSFQVCSGPVFGENTERVLDEVFFDKQGRRRHKKYFGLNPRDYFKMRDSLLGILFGYYKNGYTHITLLSNAALRVIDDKLIRKTEWRYPKLTDEQLKEVREYYGPYVKKVQTDSHRLYTGMGDRFDVEYFPEKMFMCDVDRFLNDRELSYYIDNKCLYYRLFPGVKHPEALAFRMNGIWLDKDYRPLNVKQMIRNLITEEEIVIKPADCSEGGAGIAFLRFSEMKSQRERFSAFRKSVGGLASDIVIQKPVKQHPAYSRLHPQSVNTVRVVSLVKDGRVIILSHLIRTGVGKTRVDNGSTGGICICVDSSGRMNKYGFYTSGERIQEHPSEHYKFGDMTMPFIEKCDEAVMRIHPAMGHHRLIFWDFAIDESGEVVFIEANLSLGGTVEIQAGNGPLFGEYTKDVLEEVYGSIRNIQRNTKKQR